MSYTRTYHESVHVSGTVSVSYPASQYGGVKTVSYSDNVPVTINIHVDTNPFDDSVDEAAGKVDRLTGAVAALDAAQVAAIGSSSKKISRHIVDGFFSLIKKDLSQSIAENSAQAKVKLTLLTELLRSLKEKEDVMEEDISRLRRHYYGIFHNMDEDLLKRVSMLDRPAFRLAEQSRNGLLLEQYRSSTPASLTGMQMDGSAKSLLLSARLRKRVSEMLDITHEYLRLQDDFSNSVHDSLFSNAVTASEPAYVPAIYRISKNLEKQGYQSCELFTPEMKGGDHLKTGIYRLLNQMPEQQWKPLDEGELSKIEQEFNLAVEKDNLLSHERDTDANTDRVHREMLRLWQDTKSQIVTAQEVNRG